MTIKVECRGADSLPIDSILEFQGNLKKLSSKNLKKLKKRIIEDGFISPIHIWDYQGDFFILDGHQRLQALLSLRVDGYDMPLIPVDYIYAENKEEAKRRLLSITSQYGEFDMSELNDWLNDIDSDIAETLRFSNDEILFDYSLNKNETIGDDKVPEDVPGITKPGDLWELGNHRLLCGDSTKEEDVENLMGGKKADMVFTDPPYGVEYQSNMRTKTVKFDVLKNDDKILDITPVIDKYSKGWVFVWTSWKIQNKWIDLFKGFGYPTNIIIWYKPGGGIGDLKKTFSSDYEVALVWHRGAELTGKRIGSVWKVNKDGASKYLHPTQKPVELSIEAIDKTTTKNSLILDLFGGSGSTIIGAEKTGRKSNIMELDPNYCDVIVNRYIDWCKLNQKKPEVLLNGVPFVS